MGDIVLAGKYTKLDKIAGASADISGLMANTRTALSNFKPRLGRFSTKKSSLVNGLQRDLQAATGGSDTFFSFPFSYDPSVSSPDRMWLPESRREQNRYWRTYYASDPLTGNIMDMYAEMPVSDFEVTGPGVVGSVKRTFEDMCQECEILQTLIFIIREFLVIGEVAPHCFFDKKKGIWTHITIHNPDFLEVFDSPLIDHEPVLELIPDDEMRKVFTSGDQRMLELRSRIPKEILMRLVSRMNIPLSNLNVTFLARKAHPYYVRGMSMLARLFKIFIYEDAIYDASIATARRHAGPLKVCKLGDPVSGWLPEPGEEDRVAELLAQSEMDPNAFMIYHYGIQFEAFGTTDRILNIGKEWDFIEKAKLAGLGISKAFMSGEVTYASAEKGLEVWLSRLLTLRQFFEQSWLQPKFFKPISQINEFYLPTEAEVSHRVRTKTGAEKQQRLIVPTIEWKKTLRPTIDKDKVDTYTSLKDKGLFVAPSTIMGAAGLDWKEEAEMTKKENEWLEKEGLTQESEEGEFTGGGGEAGSEGGISVAPDGLPGMPASKQTTEERTREIQQKNDKDLKFTDHRNRKERDLFLVGEGNSLQEKRIAQQLKSEVEGFGLVGEFETPEIDEAHDHGSREDWQRALENSKIPQEAKQYIKSMENQVVDGWENSFDGLWGQVEPQLKAYGSISEADISHMLVNSILDHIKHIDLDRFENDLNGIFHNGKLHSYEALNFEEYKRDKKGFKKSSVTMDSMEDDLLLRSMRERLKEHLVKLTNATLKAEMVDKIAGSLKEAVDKSASSSELKESIKKVYNDALWRLQSAVRTETTNNFTIATLLGLKEQGIKKAKWNAHNDHKTCPVCRGYNGLEFTVDYLLSLGPYPLVKMSHPQCRCWFTSVIGHVVSPIIEKALLPYRKKFPSATEEVKVPVATKKDFKVLKSEFKNVPAEYEKSIKSIRNRTQNTSFNEMWPKNVEFVPDVADSSKFIEIYGKRDDLRNRVQYWKDGSGKVWVSNFYIQDKDPNTAIIRIWAENIYSKVRSYWEKAYEQKMEVKRVPDISQDTVDRIASVLSPIPIVIPFRVGMLSGVSLNKKFRDQSDGEVRNRLVEAGVNDTDVESIVNWRTINPSWAQTGKVIEIGKKDLQQEGFVNEIAKRSAKDLFIESTANYVGDGFLLEFRDPKSYQHLKSTIFQGKKFY